MLHVAAARGLPDMISALVLLDANIDAKTLVSLHCIGPWTIMLTWHPSFRALPYVLHVDCCAAGDHQM